MLVITGFFAAILAIFYVYLSLNVVKNRSRTKTPLIFWEDPRLTEAIRAHGNFSEYVPIFLILLALMEINSSSGLWLYIIGGIFSFARVLHAFSILVYEPKTESLKLRVTSMILTFVPILSISVFLIVKFFS